MSPEDLQTGASAPTCEFYYELQNEILVTVHGLTTLDLQAMSFPDFAKIKAF